MKLYDLKTEYRTEPQGIDAEHPRFSWKIQSSGAGVKQIQYRISVRSERGLLWDSGLRGSSDTLRIRYEGIPLLSRERAIWWVYSVVETENGDQETAISQPASFSMGLLHSSDWKARWIEPEEQIDPEKRKPSPYLRKKFHVRAGLVRAVLYETAHGLYESWMNGEITTEDKFKPGLTSYYARIQYHVSDVTRFLHPGENVWAAELGDGWWRGVTGGTLKNNFGTKVHYYGQLELTYQYGGTEIIPTDESFLTAAGGLLASDLQMGDHYDARLEPKGWKEPGFDDSNWHKVHLTEEHTDAGLIASRSVPVREKEIFIPKIIQDASGRTVLDYGQNIAGYVKATFRHTTPGQRIRMVYGEDIDAEGNFSQKNIKQANYQMDEFQEVRYICRGMEEETYTPLFSYFGFRYVLLEGLPNPHPEDFPAAAVYSDMEVTGQFHCSNPLINQLVSNSLWSQKGNFLDVAVDCPTREKNAWTGDNQIYVRTAADFMNVYPFYEKWLQDQAIEQYASGKVGITFPSTSSAHRLETLKKIQETNPLAALAGPSGNGSIGEDCAGWGDSAAYIPYMIYLCYGDPQILKNQYPTAKNWADYMLACAREHNPLYERQPQYHHETNGELDAEYIYDTRMHYGEWQEPIYKTETGESLAEIFQRWVREGKPLVATAYLCRTCENVAQMAAVLGRKEDADYYTRKAKRVRNAYETYLVGNDGTIEPGHQAAYVRALAFRLCHGEKKSQVEKQLIHEVAANGYRLNTGFLSTPFLLPVLVEIGRADLAYRILESTEFPGWLHPITLGATTIPEAWNALDIHDSSYNHYSYGAVCDFLFSYTAGIRPIWETPGYRHFELKPVPGGSLTEVDASYESQYGKIGSAWKLTDGIFTYSCEVPVGTTASLTLPDGSQHELESGKYTFSVKG